jgi:hypothetical protein
MDGPRRLFGIGGLFNMLGARDDDPALPVLCSRYYALRLKSKAVLVCPQPKSVDNVYAQQTVKGAVLKFDHINFFQKLYVLFAMTGLEYYQYVRYAVWSMLPHRR